MGEIRDLPKTFKHRFQLGRRDLPVPRPKLLEPILFAQHRLPARRTQPAIDAQTPQHAVALQNQRFFSGILSDLRIRVISEDRVEHVRDVHQLMAAIAGQGRIIKPSRDQLDAHTLHALGLKILGQILLDRSPLAENVDAFLIFFQDALHQHNPDLIL